MEYHSDFNKRASDQPSIEEQVHELEALLNRSEKNTEALTKVIATANNIIGDGIQNIPQNYRYRIATVFTQTVSHMLDITAEGGRDNRICCGQYLEKAEQLSGITDGIKEQRKRIDGLTTQAKQDEAVRRQAAETMRKKPKTWMRWLGLR